jgi:hypothetical protein
MNWCNFCQGKEEHIWADITVTSVIDGGHFWAQVGGETVDEKLRNISLTLLKEASVFSNHVRDGQ